MDIVHSPISRMSHCKKSKTPSPTRPPVGFEKRRVMIKYGILMAEHSVNREPKWSRDLQHSILTFPELDLTIRLINWSSQDLTVS